MYARHKQKWVIAHAKCSSVTAKGAIQHINGNPFACTMSCGDKEEDGIVAQGQDLESTDVGSVPSFSMDPVCDSWGSHFLSLCLCVSPVGTICLYLAVVAL